MKKNRILCLAALPLAMLAVPALAGDHVVSQKGKAFSAAKMSVKVGESVTFVNDDPFAHNVFSLSDTKSFDLGSYGQGQSKTVQMDKPGVIEVECAVHPDMKMLIEVQK
ncbi:plastocyanin/azurin family copper-binding protein [Ramlibacter sp.]|uniref:cupredoxin domain-containing protein n=1 Tax=Ramlibacter sp. TaxID=1917967 RepID=UPI00261B9317|nr:plastocyanin/azurin family copper-binding protein [Ramlibacter sp.]MDB5954300.1 methylamine utilization protein [Ramlibacter sp.]